MKGKEPNREPRTGTDSSGTAGTAMPVRNREPRTCRTEPSSRFRACLVRGMEPSVLLLSVCEEIHSSVIYTGQKRVWIWLNNSIQEHLKSSIGGIRVMGGLTVMLPRTLSPPSGLVSRAQEQRRAGVPISAFLALKTPKLIPPRALPLIPPCRRKVAKRNPKPS